MVDLTDATGAALSIESLLQADASRAAIEISTDGVRWVPLIDVPVDDEWRSLQADLSAWSGHVVYIRFAFNRQGNGARASRDRWSLANLQIVR